MGRTSRIVGASLAVGVLIIGARALGAPTSSSPPSAPSHGLDATRVTLPSGPLPATEHQPYAGFTLLPPGDAVPVVGAEEAVRTAERDGGAFSSTTRQALLAVVPPGGTFENPTLVWDVKFFDACVPVFGGITGGPPRPAPPECGATMNDLVDATTGRYIVSFAAAR